MIETAQALDNLDAILSVEGLDAIYIGPSDLSLALGCKPVFDDVDAAVAQAIDHIVERARRMACRPASTTAGPTWRWRAWPRASASSP
jgi:2-keto-3-deoxy-L-rhamnonate aldolase RhmA